MKRVIYVLTAAFILTSASSALATLIVGDDFTYADGALAGNNGGTAGTGSAWSGDWTGNHSVSSGQVSTQESSLALRTVSTNFIGSSTAPMYFSAKFTNNDSNPAYALWITLGDSAGNNGSYIGIADGKFRLGFYAGGMDAFGSYTVGQQVQVVGKLEFNMNGARDRLQIWVNPTDTETAALVSSQLYIDDSKDLGWTTPGSVSIRDWSVPAGQGLVDDVKVGSTWADVGSVIPEPSTLVLVATGVVSLLAYAWRKRK
jgi:hypothetical protein